MHCRLKKDTENYEQSKNLCERQIYKKGWHNIIRLIIVYLVVLGHSRRKLSEIHNISFKQITNRVHRYENEGIEGLKDRKGRGWRSFLSDKDMQRIKTIILTEKPEKYGFKSDRWTGPLLRQLISDKYGVCYQKAQIYNLLRKIGMRFEKKKGLIEVD